MAGCFLSFFLICEAQVVLAEAAYAREHDGTMDLIFSRKMKEAKLQVITRLQSEDMGPEGGVPGFEFG
jgi:hypothetical protein